MYGFRLRRGERGSIFTWRLSLLVLVLLAFGVRLYWGSQPRVVWGDEPFYIWLGQSLLAGEGYQFFGISAVHHSPLLAVLAAGIVRLIPPGLLSGQPTDAAIGTVAVYVIAGALLVLPIAGIARRLAGDKVALVAGLLTALYPALTAVIPLWGTMTEPIYILMVAVAWWGLLVAMEEGRLFGYLVAGLALGFAYLTRSESIVYLIVGLAVTWGLRLFVRSGQTRGITLLMKSLAGPALAILSFLVVISPYLIALRAITGHWQLFEEAGSTYVSAQGLAYNRIELFDVGTWGIDSATGEVYYFSSTSENQSLLKAIAADPGEFKRRVVINAKDFASTLFSASLVPWPLAALAVLGLFARPWNTRRLRGEVLLAAAFAGPVSFVLFFVQARYLASALIPLLVWIAAGVLVLTDWLTGTVAECLPAGSGRSRIRRWTRSLAGFLPVLLLALALLWQEPRLWALLRDSNSHQPGHLAAAQLLRDRGVTADTVVLSRYPAIAFHAGTRWAPTPAATWDEVAAYAQRKGAHYLVADEWEIQMRPQLSALLDPAAAPASLVHVATVDQGFGAVVIYRFR